jgi:hypothetical protein
MHLAIVPWEPVIEQRLGQLIAAVRGIGVSWDIGRMHGRSVG